MKPAFEDLDGKPEFSPELRNNSIAKLEHELELEHDFEEELRIELELQKLSADTDRITVEDLLLVYKKKAQLWKYDHTKETLENRNGEWKFGNKSWSKTVFKGKEGYIKDKESREVLGLLDGETVENTEVILEVKEKGLDNTQKWRMDLSGIDKRVVADGWFKLKNLIAGRFLTATSPTNLTVTGEIILAERFWSWVIPEKPKRFYCPSGYRFWTKSSDLEKKTRKICYLNNNCSWS